MAAFTRRSLFVPFIILTAFVLFACGNEPTPTPTPIPPSATFIPIPTQIPSATPVPPTPTITPTPTSTRTPTPSPTPTSTRTPTPSPTPYVRLRDGTGRDLFDEIERLGMSSFNRYYRGQVFEITDHFDSGIEDQPTYDVATIQEPSQEVTFWGQGEGSSWTFERTELHDGKLVVVNRGTNAREVPYDVKTYVCTIRIFFNSTLYLSPCTEILPPGTPTPVPSSTPTPMLVPTKTLTPLPADTPTQTPLPTATLTPTQTATITPVPTPTEIPSPTNTPAPTETPTPVPTATPVVTDVCAFHIEHNLKEQYSRPDVCEYDWQDWSNVFDVRVRTYDIRSGTTFREKVVRWHELYIKDTYTIEEGDQHGHSFYEATSTTKPKSSEYCPTVLIRRFFELDGPADNLIQVSAAVCQEDWNNVDIRLQIWAILGSFRPFQHSG